MTYRFLYPPKPVVCNSTHCPDAMISKRIELVFVLGCLISEVLALNIRKGKQFEFDNGDIKGENILQGDNRFQIVHLHLGDLLEGLLNGGNCFHHPWFSPA